MGIGEVDPTEKLISQYISSTYTNYLICACLTLLALEYLQTLGIEISLLWPTPWTPVKVVYSINRYLPFVALAVLAFYNDSPPYVSPKACQILFSAPSMGIACTILTADILLYIRLYALSGRQRCMKIFLTVHISVIVVICLTCFALYLSRHRWITSPYPNIQSCVGQTLGSGRFVLICYATLLYSSLFTAALSLWFALRMYWITPNSRLMNIFYRDGAFYFVTIAVMSITNAIVAMVAPVKYRLLLAVPQGVAHNVLAARMVLHLHETALDDMGFSVDLDSRIGRMTFAPPSEIDVNKHSSATKTEVLHHV
ncbi:hypothetical protein BKA70DRAFT_1303245 [Coprinopsis sp. MPI-PUGE-AT-0042]|nr:hypothetical protein BKA70DRAFT_1303245 [Coprinopsis sp. MPI-PUGE-AT-0042]